MKILILVLGALWPLFSFGDNYISPSKIDTLPPVHQLHASIDSFYHSKIQAEISEFQSPEALAWMKWMPSVGITYTPSGQPRPSASWSTNIIYTSRKEKDQRKAKIRSIQQVNELGSATDHMQLRTLLREYDFLIQDIQFSKRMIDIDRQLFDLMKKKFDAAEIDSRSWLLAQKDIQKKEYELFTKRREVLTMESKILTISKWRRIKAF